MNWTKDQVAQAFIAEGQRRGITERGIVIALATGIVESALKVYANAKVPESMRLPHDDVGADGLSVGPFQQQVRRGPGGRWWWADAATCMDPTKSAGLFYDRLARLDYNNPNRSPGSYAQDIQRSAYPSRYDERMGEAQQIYDRLSGEPLTQAKKMAVSGDPLWLEDVLRPALGDRLETLDGWQDSGVGGTMGKIWGTIWHHTGSAGATAQSIRDGRPDLAGPLSQLHIAQDGTVTLIAVGPCNHAGSGSWIGLPTDGANEYTIGVECAYPKDVNNQKERWPDAQIISMRDVGAAISTYLGVDASRNISHREWAQLGPAGFRQGKTDPWNIDMDWFRREIAKDMRGEFDKPTPVLPPPVKVFPQGYSDRELLEYIAEQLGPWAQLGNLTLVDAVAALRKSVESLSGTGGA